MADDAKASGNVPDDDKHDKPEVKPGDIVAGPELLHESDEINPDHVAMVAGNLDSWTRTYGTEVMDAAVKQAAERRDERDKEARKAAATDRAAARPAPTVPPEGRQTPTGRTARA